MPTGCASSPHGPQVRCARRPLGLSRRRTEASDCCGRFADVTVVGSSVDIQSEPTLVPAPVSGGHLAVVETSSPYEDVPSPLMTGLVVLASWRDLRQPAAMVVTRLQLPGQPPAVNLVYADNEFRRHRSVGENEQVTAAVVAGRWLFATGLLRRHSEDRTDAGDRWARQVGGELPPRERNPPVRVDSEEVGRRMLAMLNEMRWPTVLWPGSPVGPA